ncbi:putative gamma-glutamylcyclotransferase CG2811 isoform X2 [Pseudomyrmex gracilis]|uniref:putative gamma-glutamylcyclotransferase CG2811 isoform X2 n=1 Tax=Pseudomyrmex gracilis TaxID=219809 RepID=UPI000994CD5C|nr:putative gamma-glutamylcyclotransferase CG2811 isoform X2 [Pseudomyrmex gracilis]
MPSASELRSHCQSRSYCTFVKMLLHAAVVFLNILIIEMDFHRDLQSQILDEEPATITESPLHRVFVYGTLKRGEPNHFLLKNAANGFAKFLGVGRTSVRYPLVIATKYNVPFLLKQPNIGHQVLGEVYDVDSQMLAKLDELEENPTFYERTQDQILMAPENLVSFGKPLEEVSEIISAWVYFLPRFKPSLLERPMYEFYSNNGSHGLKYCENVDESASPDDVF